MTQYQHNIKVVLMAPDFTSDGMLPAGIHSVTWTEVMSKFGFSPKRQWLLEGMYEALTTLARHGCQLAFIDGSFATTVEQPNDYDACWATANVDLIGLRSDAPVFFDFSSGRRAQKARFRGEFFPADSTEGSSGKRFLEFFQISKDSGLPKGILEISLATLSK